MAVEESKIVTLFEFTQKGYQETEASMAAMLESQKQLITEQKKMQQAANGTAGQLGVLQAQYEAMQKAMNPKSTAKEREEFEKLKKTITSLQAEYTGASGKMEELNKQVERNAKNVKQDQELMVSYQKVMSQLKKGTGEVTASMNNLGAAQKYLRGELANTDLGTEKYRKLSQELAMVSNTMESVRKEQKQTAKDMKSEADSVEALRAKAARLTEEWKNMSRNNPNFAKVRDELKATTSELNEAEQAVGVFNRNVGNYKSGFSDLGGAIGGLAPGLGTATSGFKAMTSAALKFLATPIGAVIGALVAAIGALKAAFTSSAEGQEKYNKILGVMNGVFTVLKDTIADVGEFLISIFEEPQEAWKKFKKYVIDPFLFQFKTMYNAAMGVGYAVAGIFSEDARNQSKQYFQNIKDDFNELKQTALDVWTGITDKIEQVNQKAREGLDIAEQENDLARRKLRATTELAENEVKIAKLKSAAVARDKKDAAQQERAIQQLKEAQTLVEKNAKIRLDIANREYKIQKDKNALGKSTQEDLQKEADLKAAMIREEKNSFDQQREMIMQITRITGMQKEAYKTLVKERINAEQQVATAADKVRDLENKRAEQSEIDLAKKSLAAYTANLEAKNKELKQYADRNIKLTQAEQDDLELAELLGSKAIEDIRKKTNDSAIATYDSLVAAARESQNKIIDAQKNGDTKLAELYTQQLADRQQKLADFDVQQLQYTTEQRELKAIQDEEYRQQQEDAYVAERQKLYQLQVQYNNTENVAQKAKLQEQIANQQTAVNTIAGVLQAAGTDTEAVWDKEKQFILDASEFSKEQLTNTLDSLDVFADKGAKMFLKMSKNIVKSISKIFDMKKLMEKGEASLKDFNLAIAQAALIAVSDTVASANDLISQNFDRQKQAAEDYAQFETDQANKAYTTRQKQLEKSLNAGEISEARYKIEQIKAENEHSEKTEEIERRKANKLYAIQLKEFRAQKALDIVQAGINVALGITAALAAGIPGIAAAAVIGGMGAVQTAIIASRKPPEKPEFEQGGFLPIGMIKGNRHSQGGVPISIGGTKVAEAEGGEGALILSRKAMQNSEIQMLVGMIAQMNEDISGKNPDASKFEDGGYLDYDYFLTKAKAGLDIKRKKRKLWVNGRKYKLPNKGRGAAQDQIISEVAEEIADKEFKAYQQQELAKLDAKEKSMRAEQDTKMKDNEILKALGISDYAGFEKTTQEKTDRQKEINDQINAYKELANVREAELRKQLDYDKKIAAFKEESAKIDKELQQDTFDFNKKILDEMLQSGQITAQQHAAYLDQIKKGYGVTTQDIIKMKKAQVEATKALINEERDNELKAAQEVNDFREKALEQIREDWKTDYEGTTKDILSDLSDANEAVSQLSGADLERFEKLVEMSNRVKEIDEETARLNEQYGENEAKLNDGIILSREEQLKLQEDQKRIQDEIKAKEKERADKEKEIETAKDEFQQAREDSMEQALKAFESENFDSILAQIKELGATLQENERNNWTLEKALAQELADQRESINETYDTQIAAQDEIIAGYEEELKQLQLVHDKKMADLQIEQNAFEENFNKQKELIDKAYEDATAGLMAELQDINAILANLKIAGIQTGTAAYEAAVKSLTEQIESLPKKYADGGVISTGTGTYDAIGASHDNGGIPVSIGGSKIAEIEGGEKLFTLNKFAATDPRAQAALAEISDINKSYSGVPLATPSGSPAPEPIDIRELARLIGKEIDERPLQTYLASSDIDLYNKINAAKRSASMMR